MLRGKLLIAQGGGPTAVINQSVVGIINEAKKYENIEAIYGALRGVEGIYNEDFIDLGFESDSNLEKIANTPAAALLSTRVKPDTKYLKKILKVLKAHNIRYFFYIGGNDSSDSLRLLSNEAKKTNYDLVLVHIPKTIDNDLVLNDHTPGFASAAKFVANAFCGVDKDNKALGGIYIGVVMGRHAGFLTASSCAYKKKDEDGPHLVYVPENPFDIKEFLKDVKEVYDKLGRCVIAVSEGICDKNNVPIITKLMKSVDKDMHGNVQLSGTGALGDLLSEEIKTKLNISRVRADTFGYLQRSFLGSVSKVDQKEAREVGEMGVKFAIRDNKNGSVTINRIGDYQVEYKLKPLDSIGGKTRYMPKDFMNKKKNNVTKKCIDYLRPLVGEEDIQTGEFYLRKVKKILNENK